MYGFRVFALLSLGVFGLVFVPVIHADDDEQGDHAAQVQSQGDNDDGDAVQKNRKKPKKGRRSGKDHDSQSDSGKQSDHDSVNSLAKVIKRIDKSLTRMDDQISDVNHRVSALDARLTALQAEEREEEWAESKSKELHHGKQIPIGHHGSRGHGLRLECDDELPCVTLKERRCATTVLVPCKVQKTILQTCCVEVPVLKQKLEKFIKMKTIEKLVPITCYDASRCCYVTINRLEFCQVPEECTRVVDYWDTEMVERKKPVVIENTIYKQIAVVCVD